CFACLRGCLVVMFFILWIHIARRDACTTTSPALGARRVATQEGAADMDSNASRAREVEREVWRGHGFLLPRQASEISPAVTGNPLCQPSGSGAAAPCRYWHWSDCAACRAREPVPGDRESVFYGTAARLA